MDEALTVDTRTASSEEKRLSNRLKGTQEPRIRPCHVELPMLTTVAGRGVKPRLTPDPDLTSTLTLLWTTDSAASIESHLETPAARLLKGVQQQVRHACIATEAERGVLGDIKPNGKNRAHYRDHARGSGLPCVHVPAV